MALRKPPRRDSAQDGWVTGKEEEEGGDWEVHAILGHEWDNSRDRLVFEIRWWRCLADGREESQVSWDSNSSLLKNPDMMEYLLLTRIMGRESLVQQILRDCRP